MNHLAQLSRGFRQRLLPWEEIEAQLWAWTEAFPEITRLRSIGTSGEGRALWLLSIGAAPDGDGPAVWVDANMHAMELCGSSVALGIAEDVLRLHVEPDGALHGLPTQVREVLRGVTFHVLPRLSPDGAEAVLTTGRYLRSVPRDREPAPQRARWISGDVDGDGLALLMRVQHPAGEFVESRDLPGLMLPREIEDEGPYYRLLPEGHIEHFDGTSIPEPRFLEDNAPDLNRNFPYSWAPEPDQIGAGTSAASEPETRAVVEFVSAHPEIFAWLNLHTFGGVFIRPPGHAADSAMPSSDLALYAQIAAWGERYTGYPTVNGFEEFTYDPGKPLRGDLTDFAYHQRGAIAYVCELWDLFDTLGFPKQKRFCDRYTALDREALLRLARWDRAENAGRVYVPWRKATHPQLGSVEVGGFDPRIGIWNPPLDRLAKLCDGQAAAFLRVAAMAPRVTLGEPVVTRLGGDLFRVEVDVDNLGYLPSYVLESARRLPWNDGLVAELGGEQMQVDASTPVRRELGDLDGWGRGRYSREQSLLSPVGRGGTSSRRVSWLVQGRGSVTIGVRGRRTGSVQRVVELGG